MKRLMFLTLCYVLIGPLSAMAGQSCKVNLACTFYSPSLPFWGTIVGNASWILTVTWMGNGESAPAIEKSASCTSSPSGFPYAEVDLTSPNPSVIGQDFVRFIKTAQGFVGTANLSSQFGNSQTGEFPIVCTNSP